MLLVSFLLIICWVKNENLMYGVDSHRNNLVPMSNSKKEWNLTLIGFPQGETFIVRDSELIMTYADTTQTNFHEGKTQILFLDIETGAVKKKYQNWTDHVPWEGSIEGGLNPLSPHDNQYVVVNADYFYFTSLDLDTGKPSDWTVRLTFLEHLDHGVIYGDNLISIAQEGTCPEHSEVTCCSVYSSVIGKSPSNWEIDIKIPCAYKTPQLAITKDNVIYVMDDSYTQGGTTIENKIWKIDPKTGKYVIVELSDKFYFENEPISVSNVESVSQYYFIERLGEGGDFYLYSYSRKTDKPVWSKRVPYQPDPGANDGCEEIAISVDGKMIAFTCADRSSGNFYVYLVDAKTGDFSYQTDLKTAYCKYVSILPNGKLFVSCSDEFYNSFEERKKKNRFNRIMKSDPNSFGAYFVIGAKGGIERTIKFEGGWTGQRPIIDMDNNVFWCYYYGSYGVYTKCSKMNLD